jgi:transcriptional regulator with XRE-family HTH domain
MNDKKITLQQIADESGLSIGTIHALFNGSEPGGKTLRKLRDAFGLDPGIVLAVTPFQLKAAINDAMLNKPSPEADCS